MNSPPDPVRSALDVLLGVDPAFEEALANGRIDAEHVDGLAAGWRVTLDDRRHVHWIAPLTREVHSTAT